MRLDLPDRSLNQLICIFLDTAGDKSDRGRVGRRKEVSHWRWRWWTWAKREVERRLKIPFPRRVLFFENRMVKKSCAHNHFTWHFFRWNSPFNLPLIHCHHDAIAALYSYGNLLFVLRSWRLFFLVLLGSKRFFIYFLWSTDWAGVGVQCVCAEKGFWRCIMHHLHLQTCHGFLHYILSMNDFVLISC